MLIAYYRTAAPALAREVQRLQGEVSPLLDARTSDRLQAHGDGYQDGHSAGQGAMRERAAEVCDRAASEYAADDDDSLDSRNEASALAACIRVLEVE